MAKNLRGNYYLLNNLKKFNLIPTYFLFTLNFFCMYSKTGKSGYKVFFLNQSNYLFT